MPRIYSMEFMLGEIPCRLIESSELKPLGSQPRSYYQHRHPSYEMYYITAGNCEISGDKRAHRVSAGQLLLIPPGAYHYVVSTSPDVAGISMAFDIGAPEKQDKATQGRHFCEVFHRDQLAPVDAASPVREDLDRIQDLTQCWDGRYVIREKLRAMFAVFLLDLYDVLAEQLDTGKVQIDTSVPQDFAIDAFFGRHFSSNRANELLARELSVSPRQLHRIIKKSYGVNYREKLKETRMEIASDLLVNTDKSVSEIAEVLGYSNSANFSAFVKNTTGKTPSQIRREAK